MRFLLLVFTVAIGTPFLLHGQFRGQEPQRPSVSEGVVQSGNKALLGLFNPDNFEMRHTFSMSYGMLGDHGLGTTMYINSLRYKVSEPLSVRADIALMSSPFGSGTQFMKNDLSGVFLQRASIDYSPSKHVQFSLQYRNVPYMHPYSHDRRGGTSMFFNEIGDDWLWR